MFTLWHTWDDSWQETPSSGGPRNAGMLRITQHGVKLAHRPPCIHHLGAEYLRLAAMVDSSGRGHSIRHVPLLWLHDDLRHAPPFTETVG